MSNKKIEKASELLLEAEQLLDEVADSFWEKSRDKDGMGKATKKYHRMTAVSGLAYDLRQLVDTL